MIQVDAQQTSTPEPRLSPTQLTSKEANGEPSQAVPQIVMSPIESDRKRSAEMIEDSDTSDIPKKIVKTEEDVKVALHLLAAEESDVEIIPQDPQNNSKSIELITLGDDSMIDSSNALSGEKGNSVSLEATKADDDTDIKDHEESQEKEQIQSEADQTSSPPEPQLTSTQGTSKNNDEAKKKSPQVLNLLICNSNQ